MLETLQISPRTYGIKEMEFLRAKKLNTDLEKKKHYI